MQSSQKLSILIPAYNEENTLKQVVKSVIEAPSRGWSKEIVVINDGSKDQTANIADGLKGDLRIPDSINLKVIHHEKNQGKGAAIRTGIKEASGDYVLVQDADLECSPEEYEDLLEPVEKANADVVFGSRFKGAKPRRIFAMKGYLANKFLTYLSNLLSGMNLTDMETGYKLIRTSIAKSIEITENRFGFEPEITAKLSRVPKVVIYEVGISYYGRTREEGKKIGFKDGLRAIWVIIKHNLLKRN